MALQGLLIILLLLSGCNSDKVETFELGLSAVSPSSGDDSGGTLITITGTNLKYTESVTIGGAECSDLEISNDTQMSCTTPAGTAGAAPVVVINSIGQTATTTFTYLNVPIIEDIQPRVGAIAGGDTITITGSGFVEGLSVDMGGVACTVTSFASDSIECETAAHASGYVVTKITNPDGESTTARLYAFRPNPTVSSISPEGGNVEGGTVVTISGSGFSVGASVTVGRVNCNSVVFVGAGQIRCTTGVQAAGLVDVIVTNNNGLSGTGANLFTYRAPPTVTSIASPTGLSSAPAEVTLTGTGFLDGATVMIGDTACTPVTFVNATSLKCTPGVVSGGGVFDVVVENPDTQTGTLPSGYTYVPPPTISSISPDHGYSTGTTQVTITGTNFQDRPTVTLGGIACAVSTSNSTTIECETGAYPAGGLVTLRVENEDSQYDEESDSYNYRTTPTVTSVTPSAGSINGSTSVTITGTGFADGATVDFGGSACSDVAVATNGRTLTCTTSAHAAGGVSVKVKNDDNQEGTLAGGYTYRDAPTVSAITPSRGVPSGGTSISIIGTNFYGGATVMFTTATGPAECTGVSVVNSTQINCITPASTVEGPATVTITNLDAQSGSSSGYNYQDVLLDWDVTAYDFGDSTTRPTKTFTITNTGEANSGEVAISLEGADPATYTLSAPTCPSIPRSGGTCSIDVTFEGADAAIGSYSADLKAENASGDSATSSLTGTVVDAQLSWRGNPYAHEPTVTNDQIIFLLQNTGSESSSIITITELDPDTDSWTIDTDTCTGNVLASGDACSVTVTFKGASLTAGTYSNRLRATADAGGRDDLQFSAVRDP